MKRKPTPNQTYLNKTLIPKCQILFRESGIKGIKFQKYLEYTYAIIRHNTEAELEDLYTIIKAEKLHLIAKNEGFCLGRTIKI